MRLKSKVYPNKFILIYYFALLILLVSWKDTSNAPNILLRVTYLGLFFLPLYTKYIEWTPVFLSCFYIISRWGYSYSYFPTELYIYAILVFIGILLYKPKYMTKHREIKLIIIFLLYVSFIDLINNGKLENITYSLFIIVLFFMFTDNKDIKPLNYIPIVFIVTSLILSMIFLINKELFSQTYTYESGLERVGWADPNYFGTVLGIGIVSAMIELSKDHRPLFKAMFLMSIIMSLITILLTGSRGAVLAVIIGLSAFVLLSKIKSKYKLLLIVFFVIVFYYLYNNDYLNLLLYRIENDSGTGSGRLDIWKLKLNVFFEDGNLFRWFFGYGYEKGFLLGGGRGIRLGNTSYIGFHNDYLAFFVDYGIVGFIMFLSLLIYPIRISSKRNRPVVIVGIVYLMTCSITLEPLNYGHLPYYIFYIYIYATSISLSSSNKTKYLS